MKNQISKLCTIALFITTLLLVPAGAQSFNTIQANIPFSFTVGSTTFSAGNYIVQKPLQNSSSAITISNADTKESLARLTFAAHSITPKNETTLTFHRYGDQYFLSQIWIGGDLTGLQLPK